MKSSDRKQLLVQFGKRLKELREARRLSQLKLSAMASMEAGNYAKYESGKREPGLATILLIAKGLRVHHRELLDFDFDF